MTEKCNSCDQMKKENASVRRALLDTNKNYVEVVNENLALKKELTHLRWVVHPYEVFKELEGRTEQPDRTPEHGANPSPSADQAAI